MKLLGTDMREISIKESVLQHFIDINHDPTQYDVTYENSQARERTQILMDVANKEGGLVVGTGDLSEIALGWSTYNEIICQCMVSIAEYQNSDTFRDQMGDEQSSIWSWRKIGFSSDNVLLRQTLQDIIDTPMSPELLPPDSDGKIAQKRRIQLAPISL